ncbi:hypothetical protein OG978_32400 [Streptomyces sp. NBC_01591]|uniref:hypothetical protein n=1 Tax=Streptomyces sp. NBC_01591 TaxID=2975888 RepID=UPI002DD83419|nr:hypothetical protein [Streptomyces sp. NBC_01591]WSD71675.1 hypothetical protein OG978_32400 [Streptomyces sp. NBC_01591]
MSLLSAARRLVAPVGRHRSAPASPLVTRAAACPCRDWDRLTTHTVDNGVMTCQNCGRCTAEVSRAELAPGTRWLVCDDPACGHMTTRHLPAAAPRSWACTWCGTTKGDQ